MTDEGQSEGFEADPAPGPQVDEDTIGIAWGLVAFLVFIALLATFIVQNGSIVAVKFLWLDIQMKVWVLLTVTILLTLSFDQVISLIYRRRKRQAKQVKAVRD